MKKATVATGILLLTLLLQATIVMPVILKRSVLTPNSLKWTGFDPERKTPVKLHITLNPEDGTITSFDFSAGDIKYKVPACICEAVVYPRLGSIAVNCGYQNQEDYQIHISLPADGGGNVVRRSITIYLLSPTVASYSVTRELNDCTIKSEHKQCGG